MSDELAEPAFRFTRQVRATAPKPGHHLATAAFQLDDTSVILWMIEGPENDAYGFLGMATDFHTTRLLRFGFRGPLIERLNDLPYSPDHRGARYGFRSMHDGRSSPIGIEAATTVLSAVRAGDRADPDAAAVAYQMPGRRVQAAITGYQRGWYFHHPVVAVGLALWALQAQPADGDEAALAVGVDLGGIGTYEAGGIVAYRDSIITSAPAIPADRTMARRSAMRNGGNGGKEAAGERLATSRPLSSQHPAS